MLGPVAGPLGRAPEGGRNWEGFAPDPVLTGIGMAETIKGIQGAGVQTSAKHFINNEQEHYRQNSSSIVDDRTQHEIYLAPVSLAYSRTVVRNTEGVMQFLKSALAGTASFMCSYSEWIYDLPAQSLANGNLQIRVRLLFSCYQPQNAR